MNFMTEEAKQKIMSELKEYDLGELSIYAETATMLYTCSWEPVEKYGLELMSLIGEVIIDKIMEDDEAKSALIQAKIVDNVLLEQMEMLAKYN